METFKAAAVSLYKFATRSKIEDNSPPEYTHYLPLFMIDENGNPTSVISEEQANTLKSPAGQTAPQVTTFIVTNESGVKTQHQCGGVHAYVSPHDQDLCPEDSAYYPKGARVKALMINQGWIQIQGKKEVPKDIKMRQRRSRRTYGQQSQRVHERPDMCGPDGPATEYPIWPCAFCLRESGPGSTCDFCDRIVCPLLHATLTNCCWMTICPQCSCRCNPPPVVASASDEAAEQTMTPRERLQVKQAMMIEKQAKMIEKQAGIIGRLGPLP